MTIVEKVDLIIDRIVSNASDNLDVQYHKSILFDIIEQIEQLNTTLSAEIDMLVYHGGE